MKLNELDIITKNSLALQYHQQGMAVISAVALPNTFSPSLTDLVFLKVGEKCEVYIAGDVQYRGNATAWKEVARQSLSPGNTRKAMEMRGDLFTGLSKFSAFLDQAGGEYHTASATVSVQSSASGEPLISGDAVDSSGHQQPSGSITNTARVTEQIRNDRDPIFLNEDVVLQALSESVVGQDESLRVLASAVASHVARVTPRRPLTVFAIGPTGVGKTQTGLSIVSVLNKGGRSGRYEFLRLDMCEYRESHRVSQLLGSPQGYAGYGDGAQLTDTLARNPCTVVLFDEIEKAHPDILKVLMNAMDAGRLSTAGRAGDGSREVDCRKAVFFFSSNLDSESILRALEQRDAFSDPEVVDEVCRNHLKAAGIPPELIGRIGHFLVFRPLSAESKAEIAAMQIRETASEYGLNVRYVEPDVVVDVIQAACARGGGARVYAYQIDRLLGRIFREAAQVKETGPVRIMGPAPFKYERMPVTVTQESATQDMNTDAAAYNANEDAVTAPAADKEECTVIGGG